MAEHFKAKKVSVWCQQVEDGRMDLKDDQEKKRNRPRISHTHDNCSKVERLIKEVLQHPPYSPESFSSDFHLLGPLKKFLAGKRFRIRRICKNTVPEYFKQLHKPQYHDGMFKRVSRWDKCLSV
ncbi:hypothetical protein AVEN_52016-1 [Araneus ventricosus]|uniref:Histone-lysine N-methyltransferase SETMAR n=1 Tax=Araneus ventricosus TaxID=182803 RepID=A0A4Y2CG59_ARAVE|nr:hypothetical protein AVEN_52016-1 [Araneus ventricosus]